ncbi:MAG: universal stress protein [Armatimonadetes bacterium]|nr:universal stress protein [Armatimonadota bacterium]
MFRKILVANDGSASARKAVAAAVELAVAHGAELHSICVEEDLPRYAGTIGEVEEVKLQRNGYFRQVNAEAQQLARERGLELHCEVRAGHEVETIVTYCQEGQFDLLVIGFMGHSALFGRIWGSTSQNLTRLAPCSVLVIK